MHLSSNVTGLEEKSINKVLEECVMCMNKGVSVKKYLQVGRTIGLLQRAGIDKNSNKSTITLTLQQRKHFRAQCSVEKILLTVLRDMKKPFTSKFS